MRHWGELDLDAALAWGRDRAGPLFSRRPQRRRTGVQPGGREPPRDGGRHGRRRLRLLWGKTGQYWRKPASAPSWLARARPPWSGGLGCFPARRLGMGEDLPPGIAPEWAPLGSHLDPPMGRGRGPARTGGYRGPPRLRDHRRRLSCRPGPRPPCTPTYRRAASTCATCIRTARV